MAFITNSDLVKERKNILQLGVADWADQIAEAHRQVIRILEARWYRKVAPAMGIDPTEVSFDESRVNADQLKKLETYKALELAYSYLVVETEEVGGFERLRDYYRRLYQDELREVLNAGVDYDWDQDQAIETLEQKKAAFRRLVRC